MKFAFVFPGQGSQSVGMMDVWSEHPAAMQVIAQESAALGEDLGALMAQGLKSGADGIVPSVGNLIPKDCQQQVEAARRQDWAAVDALKSGRMKRALV
ncbi:MAG: hypothetical protein WCK56_12285, partial [Alcaligenaceae bacterium]